ncbi:exosporium protein C [Paenibacillus solisilvae]|uniref:Exosporium protein C n=1 Tax=Paenibacillus solisilvae TaxID=2486751 RepID=A0ABW0VZL1_9BACL
MTKVLNYNVSVPAVVTDAVAIVVPQTPAKVILAELGIFILPEAANNNRVELKATVGWKGTLGTGSVLFRVFRDNQEIYYAREGFESSFEQFYLTTLQVIDINAAPGAHGYSLYIEKLTAGAAATVIGPINLSATVYEV